MNAHTTIAALAAEFDMEPYGVAAALDLSADLADADEITEYTEAEAREILTLMAAQAADLTN